MPLIPLKADPQRAGRARVRAEQAALLLADQFSVRRVYAFGSLLEPERFHAASDLDLAVEGLPAERYFAARAAIRRLVDGDLEFDLVPLEDVAPALAERIRATAEVLFER